jgi:hypothetical protein
VLAHQAVQTEREQTAPVPQGGVGALPAPSWHSGRVVVPNLHGITPGKFGSYQELAAVVSGDHIDVI